MIAASGKCEGEEQGEGTDAHSAVSIVALWFFVRDLFWGKNRGFYGGFWEFRVIS